jgi:chemotaxis protein MotB
MAAIGEGRRRRTVEAWPGYVDVLSTLLMVIIFVLMVFVIAQFFLSQALTGRDEALERLNRQVAELGELLALERSANSDLRLNVAELSAELQSSTAARDELSRRLGIVTEERDQLASSLAKSQATGAGVDEKLEEAYKVIEADKARIQVLLNDIAVLESLRDDLRKELLAKEEKASQELSVEKELSQEAQLQVELLNRQLLALRQQLARLSLALEASEAKAKEQDVKIVDLGKRLNAALASKVEELARYRSEFFGRLREVLGDRPDIQIVGDRFVFQSEVLFESGSAELEEPGKVQLARFADTLLEIAAKIPPEIDWILRVDGHTDRRPINTVQFKSNWELSTSRAISVVRFLESQGVSSKRLVAAGFGEYQPLDAGEGDSAYRRNRRIELKLDQR